MDNLLFNKQFLLTKKGKGPFESWPQLTVGDYTLYHHPKLEVTFGKRKNHELYLLGYAFSYENPSFGNQEIVDQVLASASSIEEVVRKTDSYTGQFVMLYVTPENICLFNDACAQREVYYTRDFSTFASQVSLLEKVTQPEDYDSKEALDFYNSSVFLKKRIFIGGNTHKKDVQHLRANHFLDFRSKSELRFFPYENPNQQLNPEVVAEEAASMLKGFILAAAKRYALALPVTAGYDSRVLFGASLEVDCRYFIFMHGRLHDQHPDIAVPRKLLKSYGKKFEVITYSKKPDPAFLKIHQKSIDFYRPETSLLIFNGYHHYFKDYLILNGNISEIARNFYGEFGKINGRDLAYFLGVEPFPYAVTLFENWIATNSSLFRAKGYPLLDMFYWEERMTNWAAKGKTEALLGTEMFPPFNSRKLISLLLSTDRKYRNTHVNQLFNKILFKLSPGLLKEPINPDKKTRAIILMNKLGIYQLYRKIGLKYRFLKF